MANARPDRPTSFEGGATEGEEDDDSNVDKHSLKDESFTSNNKQNGVPPVRNVDRYGFMGGDQYTSPEEIPKVTLDIIRKREVKWMEMFENWEKWMTKRFKRVRARCRKGIPPSLRARAWQYLCGSKFLMDQNQGKFEEYLHKAGDPKWIEDIHKDLHRQFPLHEIFALRGGHGQEDLFRILKAYTIHNPQDGYCQAQGPIAAVLLMHMPAEQAFWCLVSICEKYLPGYYSPGLEAVHIDGDVLFGLLKKSSPLIYKHLKKQKIEPILYMTEWFMCIFSRTLPWTAVLRVWDMFFCEGVKVMFRIALVLFKITLGTPEKLAECPTLYETMEKLRHIPHEIIDGEFISKESLKLNVDEKDMEKEHQYQITKRRNQREKAQSSAKTEKQSAKQKKKEKQLGNDQENKKHNINSHLPFWKTQNKLWTHKDNSLKTTVPKPTEDEPILQPPSSVSESEPETPKKLPPSMIAKMQKMEMAKILAEEAFTAKVQQTQQPDAQLSAEVEQGASVTLRESSSKDNVQQQTSQSVQLVTQTSSSDVSSVVSESISSETKVQCISLDEPTITEKPFLRSSLSTEETQLEESKRYSADGNQLQNPVQVSEQEVKSPLHFADTRTSTIIQQTHSYHKTDDNTEIHQVNLAAKLEPGQLLTYPTSQIQTRSESPGSSQLLIQETENEQHFSSDNQLSCSDFVASEAASTAEIQRLDTYKSRSQSSSPSRDLTCKSVNDPICLDKVQYLSNPTPTDPVESQVSDASVGVSQSGEVAELESLFVNPLIESNEMGWQPIEQPVEDDISSDINHAENQQMEHFEDQAPPNIDQASETISSILQQVSPVTLEPVSDETQPQHSSLVDEQSVPTNQTDLTNTHIVQEPNNLTADNEIETSGLVHQNQNLTIEPLIVKSEQIRPKHNLAANQQIQSSRPLSTEIVKVKPLKLSSTLEMEVSAISSESQNSPTIVIQKRSASPVKQLAVESLLVKTQRPSPQSAELSLSATESSSKERSPVNLVSPQENPRSEENQSDSIENQCFTLEEDPNAVTNNLVGESESIQDDIDQTNVTEQIVQHLSWQTVQNSNKDDTLIPVETEANLSPKIDSTQMKESHV